MSLFYLNLDSTSAERFDMSKFFDYTDNFDVMTSAFALQLLDLPVDQIYQIKGEDGRPDLLSYRIYGDIQYWWVLLLYNRKIRFGDFVTGDAVLAPSLDDVESLYFSLKAQETQAQV